MNLPADTCEQLAAPTFTIQSDPVADSASSAGLRRFARANAAEKTLEVASAVGEFGGQRWRSSDTFIFGYNQASASIGGYLAIPPHGPGSILTVAASLRIEQILSRGDTTPASGSSLLVPVKGDGSLPMRGTAAGWMRAGFTLHGATSSVGTRREFVSGWANRDGADSRDEAPDGLITLSRTVALGESTTSLAVFVNVSCTTFAEETDEPFRSAFTICECRNKLVTEINGLYLPPARIRLASFNAQLCELPVLATAE